MNTALKNKKPANFFLQMHPLQRILLSLGVSFITYLFIRNSALGPELTFAIMWDAFALSFIVTSWIVFFTRPVAEITRLANKEDGSKIFVLTSILVSAFASMFTVLLLIIAKDKLADQRELAVIFSITGMMFSWIMVHTIFTFHYAHMFYDAGKDDTPEGTALVFPGENKPDYLDFAYFAFIIGMTFQVSDVQIRSGKIRKTALLHGLLAFALNTFVVALTINLIAGLKK